MMAAMKMNKLYNKKPSAPKTLVEILITFSPICLSCECTDPSSYKGNENLPQVSLHKWINFSQQLTNTVWTRTYVSTFFIGIIQSIYYIFNVTGNLKYKCTSLLRRRKRKIVTQSVLHIWLKETVYTRCATSWAVCVTGATDVFFDPSVKAESFCRKTWSVIKQEKDNWSLNA